MYTTKLARSEADSDDIITTMEDDDGERTNAGAF
jgi:hypothetical protein